MAQSAAHKHDSTRRATYQDVLDAPAHQVAEIINGCTLHDGQWLLIASAMDDEPVSVRPLLMRSRSAWASSGPEEVHTVPCLVVHPLESPNRTLWSTSHPRIRVDTGSIGRSSGR